MLRMKGKSTMTKNYGFTLAEVLITLGIIGVVAAMTMPTLINQTNGAQYKAAYKKALSAISQAVTLNVALDDISFADTDKGTAGKTEEKNSIANILAQRMNVVNQSATAYTGFPADELANITKYKHTCSEAEAGSGEGAVTECSGKSGQEVTLGATISPNTFLYFNDSSMFAFDNTKEKCTSSSPCYGAIDVNGQKGPNKVVSGSGDSLVVTDIYPVVFYDQTILPASDAAKEVLYGK